MPKLLKNKHGKISFPIRSNQAKYSTNRISVPENHLFKDGVNGAWIENDDGTYLLVLAESLCLQDWE